MPILFSPVTLRSVTIPNRVFVSPMCQYSADDGIPNEWHMVHLGSRAVGGAGLVITEASAVSPAGRITPWDTGIWSPQQVEAWKPIVAFIRAQGSVPGIQLAHAGRKGSTYPMLPDQPDAAVPLAEGGWPTVAPSPIAFGDLPVPHELGPEEVAGVREAFLAAADRAVRAGFDAVELHAAHGYLLHEFLSPFSNERGDRYGGSAENRARLLREIVRGIRANHPELPLTVRISATEWLEGGFDLDAATELAGWLAEDGVDLVDVSSAANVPGVRVPTGPSYQVPLAARVRTAGLPVGAVGLITSAEQAEGILASGQADVILIGRALLENPHLPILWAHRLGAPSARELVPGPYFRARFRG